MTAIYVPSEHDPVTLGTNTATALSLSGQQLSLADVFLQNSGDTITGNLTLNGGNIVMTGTETVDGVDISAHAANASAHHNPITIGTNTASALSLSTQQLSIGDVFVQIAGDTMTGQLFVDGSSDQIQLRVQGHSSQTSALQTWETSSGTVLLSVAGTGVVTGTRQVFVDGSANEIQFRVQAHSTQSANLLTFETSAGTVVSSLSGDAGTLDLGTKLTLGTNPGISREGVGGVVSNIWVGVAKPSGLTTGYQNVVVAGNSGATTAGQNITSGFKNFLLGAGAGYNIGTGFSNVLIGVESGASITSGGGNIGIGPQVFYGGNPNNATAIGQFAGYSLLTGYGVYIGDRAGYTQQYGYHNTCVGDYSNYSNSAGSDNTAVGWYSGYNITGNRNVCLGAFAGNNAAFAGLSDLLIIANSTTSTPLIYGDFASATAHVKINGGQKEAVAIKSGNYTLTSADRVVVFTATATATLPAATGSGQTYRIICRTGTLTVDANGSETIKGELTQVLIDGEDLLITDTASGLWE